MPKLIILTLCTLRKASMISCNATLNDDNLRIPVMLLLCRDFLMYVTLYLRDTDSVEICITTSGIKECEQMPTTIETEGLRRMLLANYRNVQGYLS